MANSGRGSKLATFENQKQLDHINLTFGAHLFLAEKNLSCGVLFKNQIVKQLIQALLSCLGLIEVDFSISN